MEWNVIMNLIDPSLYIVIAACWIIGFILKQTPKIPNWTDHLHRYCFFHYGHFIYDGLSCEKRIAGYFVRGFSDLWTSAGEADDGRGRRRRKRQEGG